MVEQEDIPSISQDEDFSWDDSMGSYEDSSGEHEHSCGIFVSRPNLYSNVYDEQSVDFMGDIQDDESPMMIQQE